MTTFEILYLITAIVTLSISATALIRSRKTAERLLLLEEGNAELAKKQFSKIEEQERAKQKSDLALIFTGYNSNYTLSISNAGESTVTNVNLNFEGQIPPFLRGELESKLPIAKLRPRENVKLKAIFSAGSPREFFAKRLGPIPTKLVAMMNSTYMCNSYPLTSVCSRAR